jgi:hypothetical protein
MSTKNFAAGQAVYVWSYARGRRFEKEPATIVTGHVRDQAYESVGEPEPHVMIETEYGTRLWEPTRKVFARKNGA